ncbi:50S ribosomal protein L18 [candidate division WWE3 bacterium CG09_land_8_20_14_0_10_47_33]|uniref:Large ribosomal subunit protein uL18 n=1 Tax=candidate division WWE3 bacterium CG_4_9_14_0_2_um_filter_48_10 TaxID=1975078 RepID=A0A2M8EJX9_UNCKA|nr:MAG: 50S ribosomal protein L18 [candidate division WWE3 bacterium CG09_land_8_20_14_0_10_47_33]PIZ40536.1 MAG: 50S ribosomal protein L18 [candidate division WWE3 bacterium CG_4_10_14_0_2_um_filter_47_8]PJC22987.1 MAG: 50S ribosomal protein L18 [candidate division WWE3 bacterium CG_4_9_14_0_2_um_filter_48_10]PJE51229.1 MAG: 50S ribosomal protein L18 [candidate division WWE3 bacterium CG10_big_fil_rev_8_21_14_0_10_48_23]
MPVKHYQVKRARRRRRIRGKIFGTGKRPRLSVFRSGKHIFVQLIDDEKGKTLVAISDLSFKEGIKSQKAQVAGEKLAEEALKLKIRRVVFDRGGYKYHGRVKAVAQGARKGGLEF